MSVLLLWSLWIFIGLAFVALLAMAFQGYVEDEREAAPSSLNSYGTGGN